jgi:hypothetical protein
MCSVVKDQISIFLIILYMIAYIILCHERDEMFELSMYPYKKLFHGYKKTKITLQVTKYPYLKWQCIFSFYLVFVFYISPTRLLYITDKTFIYHRQDFYISPTRLYYRQDFYISPTRLYYRQDFYISPTRFLSENHDFTPKNHIFFPILGGRPPHVSPLDSTKNGGWIQRLAKSKQLLLHRRHPPCYSYI